MLKSEEKSSTPAPVINTPEDRTDGDRDGTLNIYSHYVNTTSVFKDRTKEFIYFISNINSFGILLTASKQ